MAIKKYYCEKSVNNVPIGGFIMLEESAAEEFLGTHLIPYEVYEKSDVAKAEAKKKAEEEDAAKKEALAKAKVEAAAAKAEAKLEKKK